MNNRRKQSTEQTNWLQKQINNRVFRGMILSLTLLLAIIILTSTQDFTSTPSDNDISEDETTPWNLILVNLDNPISKDFTVDLIAVDDHRVDVRIVENLEAMIAAAKVDGISLRICSGYRNISQQKEIVQKEISIHLNRGCSQEESEIKAARYTLSPTCSEHHSGLAVDFLADSMTSLGEWNENTAAYLWLKENATSYGFIERYPKGKADITKIEWEPWHYRFVGHSAAQEIVALNLCLEEYLEFAINSRF